MSKVKSDKQTNKRWIIIFMCLLILGVMVGGVKVGLAIYDKKKALEVVAKEKEEARIRTREKLSFYTQNESKEEPDELESIFNKVIIEEKLIEKANYAQFEKGILKSIDLSQVKKSLEKIEQETEKYNFSKEDFLIDFSEQEVGDYDAETVNEIYYSHDFIKNVDDRMKKKSDYVEKLHEFEKDLEKVEKQSGKFYRSNGKYMVKSDGVGTIIRDFGKKYKLDLTVEKEFLVPILCYHGVLDQPWGASSLFVRVNEFESQMKYLSENGYTTLFASEIANAKNYEKPVIITFDDGYKDVYTNALPILKKYNLKANVYVISGWIGGDVYMTVEMVRDMNSSPLIEIGSHTVNHKGLATLKNEDIEDEIKTSKEQLEILLGSQIKGIAYPMGSYDARVVNATKKYYSYGLSTEDGKENPSRLNRFTMKRTYVYRGTSVNAFKNLL